MRIRRPTLAGGALCAFGLALSSLAVPVGAASSAVVGTASTFGVLGGSAVTNTGPSVITGDVGVSPDTAVSGFPPGTFTGTLHAADAVAAQAQSDTTAGYDDLAGRASTAALAAGIGTLTLTPGVYTADSDLLLTGALTLDAQGDPDALFIFQVGSSLTTASASVVLLTGEALACNVYWQVGSSATLGSDSDFVGTLVALTSITATTGADVEGQLLARNGAVTLDTNTIDSSACAAAQGNGSTTTTSTSTTSSTVAVAATTTTSTPAPPVTLTSGGSSTPTPAPAPRLPATGVSAVPAIIALLLVVVGALLVWVGRPALLHSARRWFR
jgi:hypothetical protein